MVSDAQKKAIRKYRAINYDRMELQTKKGGKALIQAHASKHDQSTNAFILRAIRQAMLDDGAPPDALPDMPDSK